jgi:hypothetical protein
MMEPIDTRSGCLVRPDQCGSGYGAERIGAPPPPE